MAFPHGRHGDSGLPRSASDSSHQFTGQEQDQQHSHSKGDQGKGSDPDFSSEPQTSTSTGDEEDAFPIRDYESLLALSNSGQSGSSLSEDEYIMNPESHFQKLRALQSFVEWHSDLRQCKGIFDLD